MYVASISMDLPLSQTNCKPCGVYNCKIRFFKFFNDCMYNTIVIKSVSQYNDLKIRKSFMAYKYSMNIPMIILTKNEPLHDLLSIAKKRVSKVYFFREKNYFTNVTQANLFPICLRLNVQTKIILFLIYYVKKLNRSPV